MMRFVIASFVLAIVPCVQCKSVCTENYVWSGFNRTFFFFFTNNVNESEFMAMLFDYLPENVDCNSQGITDIRDQSRFYFGGLTHFFDCQGSLTTCDFFVNRSSNAIEARRFYYASLLNSSDTVQHYDPQDVFDTLETVIEQKARQNIGDSTNYFTYQIVLVTDYVLDILFKKSFYLEQQTEDNDIHLFAFLHNLNQSLYSNYLPSTTWSVNKDFGSVSNQNTFSHICVQIMPEPGDTDLWHSNRVVLVALSKRLTNDRLPVIQQLLRNVTAQLGDLHCTNGSLNVQFVFRDVVELSDDNPTSFACRAPDISHCRRCLDGVIGGGIRAVTYVPTVYQECDQFFTLVRDQLAGRKAAATPSNRSFILITDLISTCLTKDFKRNIIKGNDTLIILVLNTNNSGLNETIVMDHYGYFYRRGGLFSLIYLDEFSKMNYESQFLNWCSDIMPPLQVIDSPLKNDSSDSDDTDDYDDDDDNVDDYVLEAVLGGVLCLFLLGLVGFMVFKFVKRSRDAKRLETVRQFSVFHLLSQTSGSVMTPEKIVSRWEITFNQLEIDFQTQIGKGAFSIVYKGKLRGPAPIVSIVNTINVQMYSDCNVAVKTVPQNYRTPNSDAILEEIEFLKTFGYHPHVVSLLGCVTLEHPICLVMELAQQDLRKYLLNLKAKIANINEFPEKEMVGTAWQIADGMCYLMSKNLVHRDLAARNVLLTRDMRAMVADFGLCRNCTDDDDTSYISAAEGRLPVKWMALESLTKQIFSQKSDVWSFGVVLYEMFTLGDIPYTEIHLEMIIGFLKRGNRLEQPTFASNQIYQVMKNCWRDDPVDRPTFHELMDVFNEMLEVEMERHGYVQAVCGSPSV